MKVEPIIRAVLYAILELGAVFIAGTVGMSAADWLKLDWFQMLRLALALNGAWVIAVIAYLDNSNGSPPPVTKV